MSVKITILVDNHAGDGLSAEHGLSLWIEKDSHRILFDTGQGGALAPNAEKLGIDLSMTDSLVLSHGHYDHTGGVSRLIRIAPGTQVYCHPAAVVSRYGVRAGEAKPLGMQREALSALDHSPSQRIHWVLEGRDIAPAVGLTGKIPRETEYEDSGGAFFLDPELSRHDPIIDDLALWINTPEGMIICVGCCHAGLVNTLTWAVQLCGASLIRAVIGGFHLMNADDSRLKSTIASLQAFSPQLIVPCHCTGNRAIEALQDVFGARVTAGFSGRIFEF